MAPPGTPWEEGEGQGPGCPLDLLPPPVLGLILALAPLPARCCLAATSRRWRLAALPSCGLQPSLRCCAPGCTCASEAGDGPGDSRDGGGGGGKGEGGGGAKGGRPAEPWHPASAHGSGWCLCFPRRAERHALQYLRWMADKVRLAWHLQSKYII
jgi:hypothetical protein